MFSIFMGLSNPVVGVLCLAALLTALIRPGRHHAEFATAEQTA